MSEHPIAAVTRVPRPEALELVDAAEVGSLLVETERELRALEAEAERLVAAAREAEASAADAQADPATTTWMLVRLQRFVDDLRAEAARDAETIVEVARHHGQVRSEDAPRRLPTVIAPAAPPVGSGVPPLPTALIVPDLVPAPPVVEVPAPPVVEVPAIAMMDPDALPSAPAFAWSPPPAPVEPVVEPAVVAEPAPVPAPVAEAPAPPVAPVPAPAPVAEAPAPPVAPVPAPAPVAEAPAPPVAPVPAPAPVVEPTATATPVVDPTATATPVVEPTATATPATKRKRRFLPFSVVLEVLAVILILVFIVLRLS